MCISADNKKGSKEDNSYFPISFPDPRHFDTELDPWIRTLDYGPDPVPALFVCAFKKKMPTKNKFFCYDFLLVHLHQSSKITSQ